MAEIIKIEDVQKVLKGKKIPTPHIVSTRLTQQEYDFVEKNNISIKLIIKKTLKQFGFKEKDFEFEEDR